MCLSLSHINSLYTFFTEYKNEFSASKQAITVLTDDINYMDNEAKILSNDPVRQDTMMFKKGPDELHTNKPGPKKVLHIDYFPFYKAYDRSAKIDKQQREEQLKPNKDEDVQESILRKNLRLLLQDVDDLRAI